MTIELTADEIAASRERVLQAMTLALAEVEAAEQAEPCDRSWPETGQECVGRAEVYVLVGREKRLLRVCSSCYDTVDEWSARPASSIRSRPLPLRALHSHAG